MFGAAGLPAEAIYPSGHLVQSQAIVVALKLTSWTSKVSENPAIDLIVAFSAKLPFRLGGDL